MATTIDIDDIKNANTHNSAMALTASWAETFKKYALEDTEDLTDDPGASFNIFLHLTAQGAAKALFEQAARINETNESTAILPKSLLNKLSSSELLGIFGNPSTTTIALCIKQDDIINYSVLDSTNSSDTTKYLLINKDLEMTFESHPTFRLPYDVLVNCKPIKTTSIDADTNEETTTTDYNIYATYDIPSESGVSDVYDIASPNISSRKMKYNGETYIAFFLKVFQIARKEVIFYVSDVNTADTTVTFDNSLVGFEVFRKTSANSDYTLMTGLTEGNSISASNYYNYSYDYKRNSQNFNVSFSKLSTYALSVGDYIKIVVYTTEGTDGNIEFPYMVYNLNKLIVNYNQDITDSMQNALLNITVLAFARDEASTGGTTQLTMDEIRSNIISKKYSRKILITNNEIINKAKEYGLDAYKARSDIISLYYRGVDKLTYDDMILSTGMNDFLFDLNDMDELVSGTNIYLIKPTDVFVYNSSTKKFKYKKAIDENNTNNNLESWSEYVEEYNASSNVDAVLQASFPFYIQYKNVADPSILIYDMDIDDTELLVFDIYNEVYSLDKLDISYVKILRNPYKGYEDGTFDSTVANTYYITFIVYTGENTLNKMYDQSHAAAGSNYVNAATLDLYNKQYMLMNLKITGESSGISYTVNPLNVIITNTDTMITDGYIAYQASFTTNNYVTNNKTIQVKGIKVATSVSNDYSSYIPIDTNIKIEIEGKFVDSINNPTSGIAIGYYSDYISIVDYLTDYFGIDYDVQTNSPAYLTWENNVYKKYKEVEYELNKDYNSAITDTKNVNYYKYVVETDEHGDPVFYTMSDGVSVLPKYKVLHNIGDIVYQYVDINDSTNVFDEDTEIHELYTKIDKTVLTKPISTSTYYTLTDGVYTSITGLTSWDSGVSYYIKSLYLFNVIDQDNNTFSSTSIYYTLNNGVYTYADITEWDKNTVYYLKYTVTKNPIILHNAGEYKYYYKNSSGNDVLVEDETDSEAYNNTTYYLKYGDTTYTGILKNISWTNRLYYSGSIMYTKIRSLYISLIDKIKSIQELLFDGGEIYAGLKRTTGTSSKYKAIILSTDTTEFLSNIALSIKLRVKFKNTISSSEKEQTIIDKTAEYISNLGDDTFTVDALFEYIKTYVTDIEYINIIKINDYYNGSVQTITNDTTVTNEVLTVAQKIVTADDGTISFKPDITVNIIE